jgi:hypothetical protein
LIWIHLNRLIEKYDPNIMYISGSGHGAPTTLAAQASATFRLQKRDSSCEIYVFRLNVLVCCSQPNAGVILDL